MSDEADDLLDPAPESGASKPCHCNDAEGLAAGAHDADIALDELDAALAALESSGGEGLDDDLSALDLIALESALEADLDAEALDVLGDGAVAFEDLVTTLERFPGLKVTLSF